MARKKSKKIVKINQKLKSLLYIGTAILLAGCILTFVGILMTKTNHQGTKVPKHVTFIFGVPETKKIK